MNIDVNLKHTIETYDSITPEQRKEELLKLPIEELVELVEYYTDRVIEVMRVYVKDEKNDELA